MNRYLILGIVLMFCIVSTSGFANYVINLTVIGIDTEMVNPENCYDGQPPYPGYNYTFANLTTIEDGTSFSYFNVSYPSYNATTKINYYMQFNSSIIRKGSSALWVYTETGWKVVMINYTLGMGDCPTSFPHTCCIQDTFCSNTNGTWGYLSDISKPKNESGKLMLRYSSENYTEGALLKDFYISYDAFLSWGTP